MCAWKKIFVNTNRSLFLLLISNLPETPTSTDKPGKYLTFDF